MIEPKIGEVFEYKGYILKCIECRGCDNCFLRNLCISSHPACSCFTRKDGKSVKFIKMNRPEIKAGMLVEASDNVYLMIPDKSGNLIGLNRNGSTYCSDLDHTYDITVIGWPYSYNDDFRYTFGDILWKKPKETVLTMQEIADKFGIPIEQLKIKK